MYESDALEQLGVESIDDKYTDSLKRLLGEHLQSTIRKFEVATDKLLLEFKKASEQNAPAFARLIPPLRDVLLLQRLTSPGPDGHDMDLYDWIECARDTSQKQLPVKAGNSIFPSLPKLFRLIFRLLLPSPMTNSFYFPAPPPIWGGAVPPQQQGPLMADVLEEYENLLELFLLPNSLRDGSSTLHESKKRTIREFSSEVHTRRLSS